jgi:hypothetical protein
MAGASLAAEQRKTAVIKRILLHILCMLLDHEEAEGVAGWTPSRRELAHPL